MRSRDVEVDMLVNLPVRVVFTRRSGVDVTLPSSVNINVAYEDIEPRYALDDTITLPSGTEISIEAALGDISRARQYLLDSDRADTFYDEQAHAADLDSVAELLRVLAAR